uniref:Uncharacterized protein n=1 Tax=Anguilla anguilla TaxID=7936 RepID=A0A0E9PV51_ANGAN
MVCLIMQGLCVQYGAPVCRTLVC